MAIDFGAFTAGSRAAKNDYWTDVRNSQQSLIRDVAVQDGLQLAKDAQDKEWASTYTAPMLLDQQRAAAAGVPVDEWQQRAMSSILNDPGLRDAPPERQQRVMDLVRANGIKLADQLVKAGDPQRALALNKSMGLNLGPDNRADPTQVFYANGLADLGFKADPQTGMWTSPTGQIIDGREGASALNTYGPAGLNLVLAQQATAQQAEQRAGTAGVRNGTLVMSTDANGVKTYSAKPPVQKQMEDTALLDQYRQNRIRLAAEQKLFDPAKPETFSGFLRGETDAGMEAALNAYLSKPAAIIAAQPPAATTTPPGAALSVMQPPAAAQVPVAQSAPLGGAVPPMAEQIQQAISAQPPAANLYQQALAETQGSGDVELEQQLALMRQQLELMRENPTKEDLAWVNQQLDAYPLLESDTALMDQINGVFKP